MSHCYITEQDVRDYAGEQVAKGDLAFDGMELTTEMISAAMKFAAREWNSIAPYVCPVQACHLPSDTNIFFDACVLGLALQEYQRLTKEDIDYTTSGSVSTNPVKTRIDHLQKQIQLFRDRFAGPAKDRKIFINLQGAYGTVG